MAKRPGVNLSETIREYCKAHRDAKAMDAFMAIRKAHPSQKINEGTFKSTFYKIVSGGKRTLEERHLDAQRSRFVGRDEEGQLRDGASGGTSPVVSTPVTEARNTS